MTYGVSMGPPGSARRWQAQRRWVRRGPGTWFRKIQSLCLLATRDQGAVRSFLRADYPVSVSFWQRLNLIRRYIRITNAVRGYHTLSELLTVSDRILKMSGRNNLTVLEAGAGSGSSTAKLSLVTRLAGGRLVVFDSFRGIPENDERHQLLDGQSIVFRKGAFRGRLGAVKRRVSVFGDLDVCTFHKGLFAETLPRFEGPVDVALLDVDLISSTRTCVHHLYPRLRAGGSLFSQDGHLRATAEFFSHASDWQAELGMPLPSVISHSDGKLLEIRVGPVTKDPLRLPDGIGSIT